MSHPVDKYVGSRLKSKRLMVGMSQDELGKAVGVTFQQIQKYEKGLNRIGCSRLFEISSVLDASISFFFEGINGDIVQGKTMATSSYQFLNENSEGSFDNAAEGVSNREILSLVRSYGGIKNVNTRKNILSLIKAISNMAED
jgi:transcriptional regulator with XRE-family HTH domain